MWILVAAGLSFGQVYAVGRHNVQSSLQVSMTQMEQAPATLYAVDVPEVVFTFYLDRPVTLLPSYGDFERRVPSGHAAYLLIVPRALPTGSTAAREIWTDRLAGHSIAIVAPPRGTRTQWRLGEHGECT